MTYPEWQKEIREAQELVKKAEAEVAEKAELDRQEAAKIASKYLSDHLFSVFGLPAGTQLGPHRLIDGYVFKASPRGQNGNITPRTDIWVEPFLSDEERDAIISGFDFELLPYLDDKNADPTLRKASVADALDCADRWRETKATVLANHKAAMAAIVHRERSDADQLFELLRRIIHREYEILG